MVLVPVAVIGFDMSDPPFYFEQKNAPTAAQIFSL